MNPLKSLGGCAALLALITGCTAPSAPAVGPTPGTASFPAPSAQYSGAENLRNWSRLLTAAVLPNLDYPATASKPPRSVEFTVFMNPQGEITDKAVLSSSGNPDWDRASSLALRKTFRLPADQDGPAPYQAIIGVAPALVSGVVIQRTAEPSPMRPAAASAVGYAARIAAAVRPNIVLARPEDIPGNPAAEFDLSLSPTGEIVSLVLVKSSGWLDWDAAATRALRKTERFPRDVDGKVPKRLFLTLRPKR